MLVTQEQCRKPACGGSKFRHGAKALAICDETGGMSRYPTFLGAIADGLSALGQTDEARVVLDQALAKADRD